MNRMTKLIVIAALPAAISACTSARNHNEGITLHGGNAIAHNTALQLVDPWPENVQDTEFAVPARRGPVATSQGPTVIAAPSTTTSAQATDSD